jgi:hypothetical protein
MKKEVKKPIFVLESEYLKATDALTNKQIKYWRDVNVFKFDLKTAAVTFAVTILLAILIF